MNVLVDKFNQGLNLKCTVYDNLAVSILTTVPCPALQNSHYVIFFVYNFIGDSPNKKHFQACHFTINIFLYPFLPLENMSCISDRIFKQPF